jgi:hypothetical protein
MNYKRSFLGVPLAPKRNRRIIVSLWWLAVIVAFGVSSLLLNTHSNWLKSSLVGWGIFLAFVASNSLGSYVWIARPDPDKLSAGIRTLFDPILREEMRKNPPPDEREKLEWARAFQRAYSVIFILAIGATYLHFLRLLPRPGPLRETLVVLAFWIILNLPNGIYLWTEPDMEEHS